MTGIALLHVAFRFSTYGSCIKASCISAASGGAVLCLPMEPNLPMMRSVYSFCRLQKKSCHNFNFFL